MRCGIATAMAVSVWLCGASTVAQVDAGATGNIHPRHIQAITPDREGRTPVGSVALHARANPPGAELFVDGRKVSNPFDEELPGVGEHTIIAHMDGHRSVTWTQVIFRSARVELTLSPLHALAPLHAPIRTRTH